MSDRERWDRRYGEAERLHDPDPSPFLVSSLALLPRGDALDLAMGEGRNALFLAERGWRVAGVDVSPVAVFRARRLARERRVELGAVVADLGRFDLGSERWDLIVDVRFLDRALFPKIVCALRPGGMLLLEHFTTDHPKVVKDASCGPKDPARLLSPGEAPSLVEPLEVLLHEEGIWEQRRGPAALVRLLARKRGGSRPTPRGVNGRRP